MATYTNTSEHYLPVPEITDLFSYSRDIVGLRAQINKAMAGLTAYDANAANYLIAPANAGMFMSSADGLPAGRVISLVAATDATLLFSDHDGAAITDRWVIGYDDGGDGFIINDAATPAATFLDNRVTITGVSFRIATADSGATPSLADLVVESNTNVGIALLTPNGDDSTIQFGDVADSVSAQIQYNGGTNDLRVGTYQGGGELKLYSGDGALAATFASDQDAKFEGKVGFDGTTPLYPIHYVLGAGSLATAPTASYDDLVMDLASTGGISILATNAANCNLAMGNVADQVSMLLQFNGGGNRVDFGSYVTGGELRLRSGAGALTMTLNSSNEVSIGTTSTGAMLRVDQASTSGAKAVLYLDQADIDRFFVQYQGTASAGNLDRSIVAEAEVGTATRQGFLMCYVTDIGNQITDQKYFTAIYTLAV